MKVLIVCYSLFLLTGTSYSEAFPKLHDCFEKDSISCVQLSFYREAREFFERPQIEILGGISLTKLQETRQAKKLDDDSWAVENSNTVIERNSKIQTYLEHQLENFIQERSFNVNFANTARSLSNAIPEDIKAEMRGLVEEGRLKKKKLLKKLMPLLMGLKVKFLALGALTLFGLLFVAKKALIVSFIALALSLFSGLSGIAQKSSTGLSGGLFSGLGSLLGSGSSNTGGYSSGGAGWAGNGGWSSGGGYSGGGGGWDSHGSYSAPVAQAVAYSGHKQGAQ